MIWGLLLRPRFYRALARDGVGWLLGPRCKVTGERVHSVDRAAHERDSHYGEGRCA